MSTARTLADVCQEAADQIITRLSAATTIRRIMVAEGLDQEPPRARTRTSVLAVKAFQLCVSTRNADLLRDALYEIVEDLLALEEVA